jgi:glutaredoxin
MKKIVVTVIIIALLYGLFQLLSKKPTSVDTIVSNPDLIVYWGQGCPHCEKVKEYIATNKLDQKIKISLKEVYSNQSNQQELQATAKLCPEIDTSQGIGVPFGFVPSTKKCLYGDQPIIDWLSAK